MNYQKIMIIVVLCLIFSAGFGAIFYTVYRLRHHREFLSDEMPKVDQIEKAKGQTITLTETREGNRKWVFKVKEIKYSRDNSVSKMTDVQGILFDAQQKVMFTFTAPDGEYDKNGGHMNLHHGVKIYSPSAQALMKSDDMAWASGKNQIFATGGVSMEKNNFGTTQAQKAIFAMDFSKIQFVGKSVSVIGDASSK